MRDYRTTANYNAHLQPTARYFRLKRSYYWLNKLHDRCLTGDTMTCSICATLRYLSSEINLMERQQTGLVGEWEKLPTP